MAAEGVEAGVEHAWGLLSEPCMCSVARIWVWSGRRDRLLEGVACRERRQHAETREREDESEFMF